MCEQSEVLARDNDMKNFSEFIQKLSEQHKSNIEEKVSAVTSLMAASSILRETDNDDAYTVIFDRILKGLITGDPDDFHNIAVDYSRHQQPERASIICQTGIKTWPGSIDLYADALTYMLDAGNLVVASELAQNMLNNCPDRAKWSWRGFSFLLEFYLKLQPKGYEEIIDKLIEDYKAYLPHEERAYLCDAERYEKIGQFDKAITCLEEAISKLNAPQCALTLTDIYFERAKYEDAIRVATLGIAYAAEPQPSIRTAYLLFIRALSKDALYLKNGCSSPVEAKQILEEYKLAKKYVSKSEEKVIDLRIDILTTYSSTHGDE